MSNIKISQLPAASSVSVNTDAIPVVNVGVTSKVTPNQIVKAVLQSPGPIGESSPSSSVFTDLTTSGDVNLNGFVEISASACTLYRPRFFDNSKTHAYRLNPSELTSDVYINLPALTTNDTITFNNFPGNLTNKVISGLNNTLTDIGNASLLNSTIIINGAPVSLGGSITVGGLGTVTSVSGTGTVSGITLTGTVTSSGSLTLGGTLAVGPANFSSQAANTVLAAPNGAFGAPTFRSLVAADIPTLNQNTTGTASNVTGVVAVVNGGTGASAAATAIWNLTNGLTGRAASKVLAVNSSNTALEWISSAGGSVTSVALSGGTTGLTVSGSPITTSGTITLAGTLNVANGGTGAATAATARTNLGLGTVATINTTGSTTNYLRADGTWAVPAGGNYVTVNGFTTADINAAIATAGAGGTIFMPAGTYSITSTIVLNNTNVIGCGASTKLIGSTAGLGATNPILKVSTVCYLQNFYVAFDAKPSSATAGQYVLFWLGNSAVEFYGLQRNSYINGIWTGACGTSFYNPDTSSTNDTSVFSTTFSNLRVENFRYRGFDFRSLYRTGNVYSNIYVNTAQSGAAPNIITDTCDTLFSLAGAESECTISQLNIEWATFTNAGMVLDHCNTFTITSLHFEHLTPANNSAFIKANSSSGTIDSWTIYGNYFPQSPTPTPTGFSFFKIDSANNNQNGSVTNNYTANYYSIGVLNLANYSTTNSPAIFARGTDDGPVYVEVGGYQYAGNSGENSYWATFPRSGNITFISTGVNSNFGVPIRTFSGSTVFRNDTLTTDAAGATTSFYRPTTGSVAQFYVGTTQSGQLYLPASGGTPAFYSGSDYRLKENLTPISNATDRMKGVRSYTYNLIGQSDTIEGFLAHELASVCPDAVLGEQDAIDEDGNPVYQQVAPAKLIPIMAQAIKDLIGRIESLENNNG